MTVKTQRPIKIINDCGALIDDADVASAILWASKIYTPTIHHVYLHGNYAAVTVNRKKVHVHRLLMEWQIQQKLPRGMYVHHLNENKLDDRLSNLAIMVGKYHTSHHMKGVTFSDDHRAKIAQENHARTGIKIKKHCDIQTVEIIKAYGNGQSINSLAKQYHVDWSTIRARLDENPELVGAEK